MHEGTMAPGVNGPASTANFANASGYRGACGGGPQGFGAVRKGPVGAAPHAHPGADMSLSVGVGVLVAWMLAAPSDATRVSRETKQHVLFGPCCHCRSLADQS